MGLRAGFCEPLLALNTVIIPQNAGDTVLDGGGARYGT